MICYNHHYVLFKNFALFTLEKLRPMTHITRVAGKAFPQTIPRKEEEIMTWWNTADQMRSLRDQLRRAEVAGAEAKRKNISLEAQLAIAEARLTDVVLLVHQGLTINDIVPSEFAERIRAYAVQQQQMADDAAAQIKELTHVRDVSQHEAQEAIRALSLLFSSDF